MMLARSAVVFYLVMEKLGQTLSAILFLRIGKLMWGNQVRDAGERGGLRQVSGETSQTLDI